jgi:hypothetical protein
VQGAAVVIRATVRLAYLTTAIVIDNSTHPQQLPPAGNDSALPLGPMHTESVLD